MTRFFDVTESTEDKKKQLDMFFRQYGKMITYMADKNNALKIKYAKPLLIQNWYDNKPWPSDSEEQQEMLLEATDDKKWVETNLSGTPYKTFRDSKILWASKVLEDEWLLNSNITPELQEIIDELDNEASDIVGWFTNNAIFDAKADLLNGNSIDQSTKTWLWKVCDNLIEDMWDEQNWGWFYDTFDYLSTWLDLEEAQKQELLEKSWMNETFNTLTAEIGKLKVEVSTNPTKENIDKLNELTWKYLALKKEFKLMMYAISQAKENKDILDYVVDVVNGIMAFISHTFKSMFKVLTWDGNFWDWIHFFVGLAIVWWVLVISWRAVGGIPWKIMTFSWRKLVQAGVLPWTWLKYWLRKSGVSSSIRNNLIKIAKDWHTEKAERWLYKAMAEWKITWEDAVKAAKQNKDIKHMVIGWNPSARLKNLCKNVAWLNDVEAEVFSKYYTKNKKVAKSLLDYSQTRSPGWKYTMSITSNSEWLKNLKLFDDKVKTLTWNTATYFDDMFKKMKNLDDIKFMTELAWDPSFKSAITKLDAKELKQFKKLSIQEVHKLKVNNKLNGDISEMMKYLWKNKKAVLKAEKVAAEAASEVFKNLSPDWKNLYKAIDKKITNITEIMQPGAEKTVYIKQIEKLEEFKKTLSIIDSEEIKIYQKIFDNVEARHFTTMLEMVKELKRVNASEAAIWLVVKWFANADVTAIKTWLKIWKVTRFDTIIQWFTVWIKKWTTLSGDAAHFWKLLLKILKFMP